ncbi:hypothetical protein KAFR_0J01140 [Kazachstania africana CBS 2517]|uniref:Tyrosine specific protein phosphatases domain-containing protein n=1 Tax=Kazachstania africana (strain ATCC 22294 / BCRC 22015 / CBS 2517 / CECT 1963 / NBRC 1671 / NRRL Y-8276) TaxID=1071382 RepID=H2B0N1_KAZAF|nr:hypothetical protein KAFR_0J01140 [Kazachstania africana CBS 2517]CCF60181.1 hypothetical protein KAFR_0J01140 [Kazachstania africana CBS 2517]
MSSDKKKPSHFIPPLNFSPVISTDVSLYRSGYPMPINYPFIRDQLNLKTVIYIGDKKDTPAEYLDFLKDEKIKFYHIPMESCRDIGIKESMNDMLKLVLNFENYPILMHSNKGKHRVGVAVGIIRKFLQGWSTAGVYQEYGIFSGGLKDEADLEFITMFESQLEVNKSKVPGFAQINFEKKV